MVAVPCDVRFSIALAVYTRSPAAYEALRDFKLLQLPSVRTLKYYIDANLNAGDSMERLKQSRKQYVAFTEEKRKESMDKATTSAGLLECMYPQSQSVGRHLVILYGYAYGVKPGIATNVCMFKHTCVLYMH